MLEAKFYETYYFCNVIRNVLHDQLEYWGSLHEFYGDDGIFYLVEPFQKYSAFHYFIEFIIEDIYHEETSEIELNRRIKLIEQYKNIPAAIMDMKPNKLPIELAFVFHSIEHLSFEEYLLEHGKSFITCSEDDVYEYMSEIRLSIEYETLIQHTVKEVFHVLFQNRGLLLLFNEMIASSLKLEKDAPPPEEKVVLFAKPGVLVRKSIPKWVKRAVFFRDRGRCVLCDKDLSGMVNIENLENYDHIVPLAEHGLNDISNIQLLCKECNQTEKRDGQAVTSNKYQSWYRYD
ncbi:HNH endonuclease [Thalassomonas actiniarum]|uniref:HNH endonuclease n=1 Tax=Thalassomonas actiniarum TaxID=485447 RepID=A0AAE9YUU8_9GAMM|nr:HNH endonuclease signature motif containing protein [Thalassomonas actiniarum]WDE00740.1 HNH endonuclease [Thalassomonas actiniarum]